MARRQPIDIALARAQHAAYRRALAAAGVAVTLLPELKGFPDCCFVEDCAVIVGDEALVTRLGTASRVGEAPSVAAALQARCAVQRMVAPGRLEGGDVMRVGRTVFVGRSTRTNEAGIAQLREVVAAHGLTLRVVPVPSVLLHLKCACSALGEGNALVAQNHFEPKWFEGIDVVWVPPAEAYAANAVVVNGHVLLAAGFPVTRARLVERGFVVTELSMSEIRKADGSLTCLSLLG
jgi:dimethylargininase